MWYNSLASESETKPCVVDINRYKNMIAGTTCLFDYVGKGIAGRRFCTLTLFYPERRFN